MNGHLIIEHLEEKDIDKRIELLLDYHVQKNLNSIAMTHSKKELYDIHERGITKQQTTKRYFVIKTPNQKLIGYCWITSIDWINRTCELSIGIRPQYRVGYGLLALVSMYEYLYNQLNMRTITNQILEGNELLRAKDTIEEKAVRAELDSYTVGRFRDSYTWTQTYAEHLALGEIQKSRSEELQKKFKEVL